MELTPANIIALCALLVSVLTFSKNGFKDNEAMKEGMLKANDAVKEGLIKANIKLDGICATTNETRSDIKAQAQQINALQTEIEVLKRDLKTAFSKIEVLERSGERHE